jgi:hypothetical protein
MTFHEGISLIKNALADASTANAKTLHRRNPQSLGLRDDASAAGRLL